MTGPVLPSAIERGLLGVRSVLACTVEGATRFDASTERWVISVVLRVDAARPFVGTQTRWCVVLDGNYPFGGVTFYPATAGGLTATFPHQDRNEPDQHGRGWRAGKLCLDSPFRGERRPTSVRDPVGDAESRLRWHVERALAWLAAAAEDQLLAGGDPFELPYRPRTTLKNWAPLRLVHDESADEFRAWDRQIGKLGIAELGAVVGIERVIGVKSFAENNRNVIRSWTGRPLGPPTETVCGVWWLWPRPIVLLPWYTPGTWGELRKVGKSLGVDVNAELRRLAPSLRGRKERTILLLGYPIPTRVGLAPSEIHWDGLLLPRLEPPTGKPASGFRPNALGWWQRDRQQAFGDKVRLEYLRTENWSAERLQARGRLPVYLRDARVAIVGVGALGSILSEYLVRAGTKNIALYDGDTIAAGNICRHTGTLADIGKTKVGVVASRLMQISPAVRVNPVEFNLDGSPGTIAAELEPYDVVVDCTASDDALAVLSSGWWSIPRVFASFSLGFGAKRLYSFGVTGHAFPQEEFKTAVSPWLTEETAEWAGTEELLEGAGCWSPLFPARNDDVAIAAAICVRELETLCAQRPRTPRLRLFERQDSEEGFMGFSARPRASALAEVG